MPGSRPERRARAALLALGLLLATPAGASEALPPRVQASVFRRIFAYDPALRGKPRIKVLVLHGRLSAERARDMAAAFEAEGLAAAQSDIEVRPDTLDDATVLYVLPDVPAQPLAELARERRLLTLSGEAEAAENADNCLTSLRVERIDETGDEKLHSRHKSIVIRFPFQKCKS